MADFLIEQLDPGELRAHPRNYRSHPDDQIEHLCASIRENGLYRNVVIAADGTILAGHGVVEAAKRAGLKSVAVVRLPIAADSPAALKVLTGDNEIEHLAEQDDRLLSKLLREVNETLDLLGTGYDEAMLANLVYVTRPASEIADMDEAAHWVGMPEYDPTEGQTHGLKVIVSFKDESDKASFFERLDLPATTGKTGSIWWPPREREDLASLRLEEAA